jgi:hypothetical protein
MADHAVRDRAAVDAAGQFQARRHADRGAEAPEDDLPVEDAVPDSPPVKAVGDAQPRPVVAAVAQALQAGDLLGVERAAAGPAQGERSPAVLAHRGHDARQLRPFQGRQDGAEQLLVHVWTSGEVTGGGGPPR